MALGVDGEIGLTSAQAPSPSVDHPASNASPAPATPTTATNGDTPMLTD
jgi:hypothetical protein